MTPVEYERAKTAARKALQEGVITQAEYAYYLQDVERKYAPSARSPLFERKPIDSKPLFARKSLAQEPFFERKATSASQSSAESSTQSASQEVSREQDSSLAIDCADDYATDSKPDSVEASAFANETSDDRSVEPVTTLSDDSADFTSESIAASAADLAAKFSQADVSAPVVADAAVDMATSQSSGTDTDQVDAQLRSENVLARESPESILAQSESSITNTHAKSTAVHPSLLALRESIAAVERAPHTAPEKIYSLDEVAAEVSRKPRAPYVALFVFLMGIMGAALFFGVPTGLVTFEEIPTTYSNASNLEVSLDNVTRVGITGSIRGGSFAAYLSYGDERKLVHQAQTPEVVLWTQYSSYAQGDVITLEVNASSYTLWLVDAFNSTPIDELISPEPGTYTIDALMNDTGSVVKKSIVVVVREDSNASANVLRELPILYFSDACVETCSLQTNASTGVLEIETDGLVTITQVHTQEVANTRPEQLAVLPRMVFADRQTLDFTPYFADRDGDALTYDVSLSNRVNYTVDGSLLTLHGGDPGTHALTVYVSDLEDLITTDLEVVFTGSSGGTSGSGGQTGANVSIGSSNSTSSSSNASSSNVTSNVTIVIPVSSNSSLGPVSADCQASDPNKRPLSCLQNVTNYFVDQEIILENLDRSVVGKFTPIGNLLIRGDYVAFSDASPGRRDWSIGYVDGFGDYHPTIWIASDTGTLHARGPIVEANTNIVHREGLHGLTNKRGVVLALANREEGSLIIRGNVIPYRRFG